MIFFSEKDLNFFNYENIFIIFSELNQTYSVNLGKLRVNKFLLKKNPRGTYGKNSGRCVD